MNCIKKLIVSLMAAVACALPAPFSVSASSISGRDNQTLIDSISSELATKTTAADSIPLLYHIYDLSSYGDRVKNAETLLETATRAGDVKVQLDMCNHIANAAATLYNPDLIDSLLERLEDMPESTEKKITVCFVRACGASAKNFESEQERSEEIKKLVNNLNSDEITQRADIYDRIAKMFTVATYMGGMTQGTVLTDILDKLDQEIARLPYDQGMILRNKFYTTAAIVYARNEDFDKALIAERKLMSIMDRMQAEYEKQGRIYRDFQIQRYVVYRRMMKDYYALNNAEVEAIYDRVKELAKVNPDIERSTTDYPVVEMAYMMKHKRYADAIPLLQKLAAQADNIYDKRYFLRRLKSAADATGNREVLLDASAEYNNILEEFVDMKSAERMRELQMLYDYQALRHDNSEMELKRQRTITVMATVAALLLVILVIVFIVMVSRLSHSKRELATVNERLTTESEELRKTTESLLAARDKARQADTEKTQLVNYVTNEVLNPINSIVEYSQMIIDNAQGENKKYLEKFKSIVGVNIRLLQGLVADVQELAVIESGKLPVNRMPVDVNLLGSTVVDSILPQVNPDVKISFRHSPEPRLIFNTDPRRVEIVLLNLLSNAAKFTDSGSIELAVEQEPESGNLIYSVTDTGIGVPADKAEVIFNRFEKLNPDTEGSGLGLSVCVLVARALGATVRLDVTHKGPGARFLFILPPVK